MSMACRLPMAVAAAGGFAATACTIGGASPNPVPVEVVYAHVRCLDPDSPAVRRIDTEQALHALTRPRTPLEPAASSAERLRLPAPATAWLLRVGMGQRPTAGYSIAVVRAEVAGDVLTVHVDWQEPVPGMSSAQVITHPCVVLQLAPLNVTRVRVVDQVGRVRADAPLRS